MVAYFGTFSLDAEEQPRVIQDLALYNPVTRTFTVSKGRSFVKAYEVEALLLGEDQVRR